MKERKIEPVFCEFFEHLDRTFKVEAMRYLSWGAVATISLTCCWLVQAGEFNAVLSIGDKAPAWKGLPGVDGEKHSLEDFKEKPVVVVVFTCNSCPIATDYEDRLLTFAQKYAGPKGSVGLVAINVNTVKEDSLEEMTKRAKEKGFTFPYLFDETQQIARDYGAIFTPEFYVLNKDRQVVYMGGLDDSSNPKLVKNHYLEPAVEAALKGGKPAVTETLAIGCRVRYERRKR